MAKLTDKQKRFVNEYLIDFNGTQAYIRAGYKATSNKVAEANARKLLAKHSVQEYLNERQDALQKRTEITQDKVLKELAKIAFANGADFAKVVTKKTKRDQQEIEYQQVEIPDTDSLPEDKRSAIASIKETKYGISVESHDKVKALELIGRHLGMFKDKVELTGDVNVHNPFQELTTEELKKLASMDDSS